MLRSFYAIDTTSLEMRFIQLDSEGKWLVFSSTLDLKDRGTEWYRNSVLSSLHAWPFQSGIFPNDLHAERSQL